ncbi:MAG: mechanosensitive ion channel family protein [Bdellovibrionales bacterium]|nr:mechanosensitive ion channel family protein [Bdellovibrionales bacterium]
MKKFILMLIITFLGHVLFASALAPVKLDTPRATMKSFLEAMKDYNEGRKSGNEDLLTRINDATRTMDFSAVPALLRKEKSKEYAILLKEIFDRVIIIDIEKIPDDDSIKKWRLKDTEIIIRRITSGDNEGDYLFSKNTVERIPEFYKRVKNLNYLSPLYQGAGYKAPIYQKWIPEWAKDNLWGLKKFQWIGVFLAILIGLFVKKITEFSIEIFIKLVKDKKDSLRYKVLTAVERPAGLVLASAVWFFFIFILNFEGLAQSILFTVTQVTFSIAIIWAAYKLTDIVTDFFAHLANKTESELDDQLVPLISKSLRVFVAVIGVLVTIQNLGFNVMSLLAGLGLGGLAFALAAKDTAANLFGSIMILIDQPFKVGDWIRTNNAEGTVEEVGFRSTRIRTFYDSVISLPNSLLANEKIDNMGQRKYRRVKTFLGLTYDTTPEKMEAFLEGLKNILNAHPHVRKDYYHVIFDGYGEFSLNILLYYFLEVPNWNQELLGKQNINLEILRLAKEIDVQFAFPTQSLFVEAFPGKEPLRIEKKFNSQDLKQKADSFGPGGSLSSPSGRGIFIPPYEN